MRLCSLAVGSDTSSAEHLAADRRNGDWSQRGRRRSGSGLQMDSGQSGTHENAVEAKVGHAARQWRRQGGLNAADLGKRSSEKRSVTATLLRELRTAGTGSRLGSRLAIQELGGGRGIRGVAEERGGRTDQSEAKYLRGAAVVGDVDVAAHAEVGECCRALESVEIDGDRGAARQPYLRAGIAEGGAGAADIGGADLRAAGIVPDIQHRKMSAVRHTPVDIIAACLAGKDVCRAALPPPCRGRWPASHDDGGVGCFRL